MESVIVHITSASAWDSVVASGSYQTDSLATKGFIHFSFPHQVVGVANAFYRGQIDLVLLVVDVARLRAPLRLEVPEPGAPEFPHLYGPLNTDSVVDVHRFNEGPDGFELPTGLRP